MSSNWQRAEVFARAEIEPEREVREIDDSRRRILILGDFSGRAHRRAEGEPIEGRAPRRIDRDDVDAVVRLLKPEVHIQLDASSGALVAPISSLDDFHPDRLLERVPFLRALRDAKGGAAVRSPASAPSAPVRPVDASSALSSGSLLDQVLDVTPNAGAAPANAPSVPAVAPARDDLSAFVQRAVAQHRVDQPNPDARENDRRVDAALAATLRVILHDRAFIAVESLWRGIDFLTRRLDTDESLQVFVLDLTKSELAASAGGNGALRKILTDARGWSLAAAAFDFGAEEIATLGGLARLASESAVPMVVGARPSLVGADSFASDPDEWGGAPAEWDAWRSSPEARYLAVALPHLLMRVPYGKNTDACETLAFEEFDDGNAPHAALAWGSAVFACALILGESGDGATQGTIGGLPLYVAKRDGIPEAAPCAEVLLSQRVLQRLLDSGFTPLASEREGDRVRLPRIQSVASPTARLASAGRGGM
jgi:type VI secretion system protein ImpC